MNFLAQQLEANQAGPQKTFGRSGLVAAATRRLQRQSNQPAASHRMIEAKRQQLRRSKETTFPNSGAVQYSQEMAHSNKAL